LEFQERVSDHGIATNYVEAFGGFFSVDPFFFAKQHRSTSWEDNGPVSKPPAPPSTLSDRSFSIRYPELIRFLDHGLRRKTLWFFCGNVDRPIQMFDDESFRNGVGIISRKMLFWSRISADGNWESRLRALAPLYPAVLPELTILCATALLLVDPQVQETWDLSRSLN
jgi:hypothetical protein